MSRVRVPDGVPNGPLVKWPKTPASHAGNSGSNPLRVTKGINNARTTRYILVGVDDVEGPPVPIPNTVVKLNSAENTWLEAAREDRSTPTLFLIALIAQSDRGREALRISPCLFLLNGLASSRTASASP